MKIKKTIVSCSWICLLTATVIGNTPSVEAYNALKAQPNFSPSSPEVAAIVAAIEEQEVIPGAEAAILYRYYIAVGGDAAWSTAAERLGAKSSRAEAKVKWLARDASGWTPEMIEEGNWDAVQTALFVPSATDAFKDEVFASIEDRLLDVGTPRKFFKAHRATLPEDRQIEVTQKQKALLLAKLNRTDDDNAWLAEICADLLAMELGQQ